MLLLLLAVAALAVIQTGTGHLALTAAGVLGAPAGYTSLSFVKPQALPDTITASPVTVDLSFAIHNATPDGRDYRWTLTLSNAVVTDQIFSGTSQVPSGETRVVTEPLALSCKEGPTTILISLADPVEHIDAHIGCA